MIGALESLYDGLTKQETRENVARKSGEHAGNPASKWMLPWESMMSWKWSTSLLFTTSCLSIITYPWIDPRAGRDTLRQSGQCRSRGTSWAWSAHSRPRGRSSGPWWRGGGGGGGRPSATSVGSFVCFVSLLSEENCLALHSRNQILLHDEVEKAHVGYY